MYLTSSEKPQIKVEDSEHLDQILEEIGDVSSWENKSIKKFLKWALSNVNEIIDKKGFIFLTKVAKEFIKKNKVRDLVDLLGKNGIEYIKNKLDLKNSLFDVNFVIDLDISKYEEILENVLFDYSLLKDVVNIGTDYISKGAMAELFIYNSRKSNPGPKLIPMKDSKGNRLLDDLDYQEVMQIFRKR